MPSGRATKQELSIFEFEYKDIITSLIFPIRPIFSESLGSTEPSCKSCGQTVPFFDLSGRGTSRFVKLVLLLNKPEAKLCKVLTSLTASENISFAIYACSEVDFINVLFTTCSIVLWDMVLIFSCCSEEASSTIFFSCLPWYMETAPKRASTARIATITRLMIFCCKPPILNFQIFFISSLPKRLKMVL